MIPLPPHTYTHTHAHRHRLFLRSVLYENASIFYTWHRVIRAKPSRVHREILYAIRAKLYCDSTLLLPTCEMHFSRYNHLNAIVWIVHVHTYSYVSVRIFGIYILIRKFICKFRTIQIFKIQFSISILNCQLSRHFSIYITSLCTNGTNNNDQCTTTEKCCVIFLLLLNKQ